MIWTARMIGPDEDFAGAPLLRREVGLDPGAGEVAGATLHLTARGVVTAVVNGRPVSNDVLTPGWTSYEWRLRYRSYDVTSLVREAAAEEALVLGLALGNGWFRGRLGWSGGRAFYGSELGALAQLEIVFADGTRQVVGTDEAWQAGPSDVVENDLYDGETVDARLRDDAWQRPGCARSGCGRRPRRRPWSTSGRTSSAGSGSRCAASGGPRSRSATRRCSTDSGTRRSRAGRGS